MKISDSVVDLALATAASYVGTRAMEPVSMKLYEWEPAADRAREDAAPTWAAVPDRSREAHRAGRPAAHRAAAGSAQPRAALRPGRPMGAAVPTATPKDHLVTGHGRADHRGRDERGRR